METDPLKKLFDPLDKDFEEKVAALKGLDAKRRTLREQFPKAPNEIQKQMIAKLNIMCETIQRLDGKASEQARIAEYNSLSSFINSRNTSHMTLNSFLVTGAAVALTFAVSTSSIPRVGGWVALFPGLLIALAWTNLTGVNYVDKVTFNRITTIENELRISGHTSIYKEIHANGWYKLREIIWHIFYITLLVASLATAVHLFWPTVL